MSPSATVCLRDVFLIVFGQQRSSVAQRMKIRQRYKYNIDDIINDEATLM